MNSIKVLLDEDVLSETSLDEIKGGQNSSEGKWCCIFNFACNEKGIEKPEDDTILKSRGDGVLLSGCIINFDPQRKIKDSTSQK